MTMEKHRYITLLSAVVFLSFFISTGFGAPPKVIKTVPENGSKDIDPKLREIRVIFDQDMNKDTYSICGGGANYPKTVGKPRWINNRTIVINVQLVSEHKYQLSINSPNYKGFQNLNGEPAIPYSIRFQTGLSNAHNMSRATVDTDNNIKAIQELRRLIDENYSYRDLRKVNWNQIFDEEAKALQNTKTPEQFAKLSANLLANAKDKHIWLTVGEQMFYTCVDPVTPNANFSELRKFVPNLRKRSKAICTGYFNDGIGYILIDNWIEDQASEIEEAYAALWEFADTHSLIIDVRENGGGAELLARQFAGCFIEEPKIYARHIFRAINRPSGFTEPYDRVVKPNKYRPRYRGKVTILTGPAVMSSCEAFLLMMKQVPNCKLVGLPSHGSSGNPKPYNLGNGVTVFLPSWKVLRLDGTCFEGEGIKPDIIVETTQSELLAKDVVLDAALELLRKP